MSQDEDAVDPSAERRGSVFSILGPGLTAGASDDDPSGIATYSQVGAQFGYALGWTLVLSIPLMAAIQEISARIGRVSGHGIAGNLARHYPRPVLYAIVSLLFAANAINIGADLGAMGAALKLLIGGPAFLYVVLFGTASVLAEVFIQYARYEPILKWLTLSLFAYVATVFIVDVPNRRGAWWQWDDGPTVPLRGIPLDRPASQALKPLLRQVLAGIVPAAVLAAVASRVVGQWGSRSVVSGSVGNGSVVSGPVRSVEQSSVVCGLSSAVGGRSKRR